MLSSMGFAKALWRRTRSNCRRRCPRLLHWIFPNLAVGSVLLDHVLAASLDANSLVQVGSPISGVVIGQMDPDPALPLTVLDVLFPCNALGIVGSGSV